MFHQHTYTLLSSYHSNNCHVFRMFLSYHYQQCLCSRCRDLQLECRSMKKDVPKQPKFEKQLNQFVLKETRSNSRDDPTSPSGMHCLQTRWWESQLNRPGSKKLLTPTPPTAKITSHWRSAMKFHTRPDPENFAYPVLYPTSCRVVSMDIMQFMVVSQQK